MADGNDEVRSLYRDLLASWNARDPAGFAACFAVDGTSVGFDGSTMEGREQIASHLREVFDQHQTPAYVARVKELRLISADAALLRAVVGMVPAGGTDINPAVNAVQSLLAVRQDRQWRIALLQSTPAAFHGRPELGEALTEELRGELRGTD